MRDYVIFVDSACDISCDLLNEWGVNIVALALCLVVTQKNILTTKFLRTNFMKK